MKHSDIIDLFGGIRPMATALGHKNASTVQNWAAKGIPKWRWHEVLVAAKRKKVKIAETDLKNGTR